MDRPRLAGSIAAALIFCCSATSGAATPTIEARVSATGFWERRLDYDWNIQKAALSPQAEVPRGRTVHVAYRYSVERVDPRIREEQGARGQVCVRAEEELEPSVTKLTEVAQQRNSAGWADLSSSRKAFLLPAVAGKEVRCFPFEVKAPLKAGIDYRVKAELFTKDGGVVESHAPFRIPPGPSLRETARAAVIEEQEITCPQGFTCVQDILPKNLDSTASGTTSITIHNDSVECNSSFLLDSATTLTTPDTGARKAATSRVLLATGPCEWWGNEGKRPPLSPGYWQNHAGGVGGNQDEVSPKLPIALGGQNGFKTLHVTNAAMAREVFGMRTYGSDVNGITMLYRALLVAKLNLRNQAAGTPVAPVISAADSFLETHDHTDWTELSPVIQDRVLGWVDELERFNGS